MTKWKKVGIVLILIGLFIPSVLYPFTSLTSPAMQKLVAFGNQGSVYEPRLNELEIVFMRGVWVPYHYMLAVGITVTFLGIGMVRLSGNRLNEYVD